MKMRGWAFSFWFLRIAMMHPSLPRQMKIMSECSKLSMLFLHQTAGGIFVGFLFKRTCFEQGQRFFKVWISCTSAILIDLIGLGCESELPSFSVVRSSEGVGLCSRRPPVKDPEGWRSTPMRRQPTSVASTR